jgi:two-component system LytT family response regulator
MIRALILDDEPSAIETLTFMIQRYVPEITELRSTRDPLEGIELLQSFNPQLLFLDVQMPKLNGFEVLKKVDNFNFEVIFTTAFNQYAIEAIRFSALDYLLKPIDADDLKASIQRFIEKHTNEGEQQKLIENLKYNLSADHADFKLAVTTTKGTFFYPISKIMRLEGDGNYTRLFFDNDKPLLTSKTLKDFEEILAMHGFIRIHRSHLVNKQFVESVLFEGYIEMKDKSKIEISRRRKEMVMQELKKTP